MDEPEVIHGNGEPEPDEPAIPAPDPEPELPTITVTIQADGATQVRSTPNVGIHHLWVAAALLKAMADDTFRYKREAERQMQEQAAQLYRGVIAGDHLGKGGKVRRS